MLCTVGLPQADLAGWSCEPKLDGWRVRVLAHGDSVTVRTRRDRTVTDRVPTLAAQLTGRRLVLDGELIAHDGSAASFYGLSGRLAGDGRHGGPQLTLAVFDVLWHDGTLLVEHTYEHRRARIEGLDLPAGVVILPRWPGTSVHDALAVCEQHGVEGVVLKRNGGRYVPGRRSRSWRKVKCDTWRAVHGPLRMSQHRPMG